MIAAGSPATKEYRPHRSERSTDSSKIPGPSPAKAGNTETGVATSARSSAHTGTSGQFAANRSKASRSGRAANGWAIDAPPEDAEPRTVHRSGARDGRTGARARQRARRPCEPSREVTAILVVSRGRARAGGGRAPTFRV